MSNFSEKRSYIFQNKDGIHIRVYTAYPEEVDFVSWQNLLAHPQWEGIAHPYVTTETITVVFYDPSMHLKRLEHE